MTNRVEQNNLNVGDIVGWSDKFKNIVCWTSAESVMVVTSIDINGIHVSTKYLDSGNCEACVHKANLVKISNIVDVKNALKIGNIAAI